MNDVRMSKALGSAIALFILLVLCYCMLPSDIAVSPPQDEPAPAATEADDSPTTPSL